MNVKLVVIQLLSTRDLLDTLDKINRALELCDNYLEVRYHSRFEFQVGH